MRSIFKKKKLVDNLNWLGVDIHSHILPGIDDGSAHVDDSISYIKALQRLGLSKFICTPHIFPDYYPNTAETISIALQTLKNELIAADINVEITAAAEYMVHEGFEVTATHLCLSDSHILIEMRCGFETPNIRQTIFNLQIQGYTVVLAHPERYIYCHRNYAKYLRFKELGVLFQLNLLSVLGYYGKAEKLAAAYLLKNKLYEFAGTDLHHEAQLEVLTKAVLSGELYEKIGDYTFNNSALTLDQRFILQ